MTGATDASPARTGWWTALRAESAPARAGLFIVAGFTLFKLALVPFVGLDTNEAYAIAGGRHLQFSYFDHPPLHFWMAHLCALVFGDTRYARIPFILLGAGASWLLFALTRRLYGDRAALWAVLALNLSIFFSLISGNWILPDGPLNIFLLAAALALSPLATAEQIPSPRRWLLAGLWLGLAALSKYHAAFFAVSVFLLIATDPLRRRILLSPWPYLGLAVAAAIFSPVLIWNGTNHWVSFAFQGGRAAAGHRFRPGVFVSLLAAQFAMISPWVAVPLGLSVAQAWRRPARPADRYCLWLGLPLGLFMTFAPLWSGGGMLQWAMPGWLLLFPLFGDFLARKSGTNGWPGKWAAWSAAAFAIFAIGAASDAASGWIGAAFPEIFRKGDPLLENLEWTSLPPALAAKGLLPTKNMFLITFDWRAAAKLDQAFDGRMPVVVFSADPRSFGYLTDPNTLLGTDALVLNEPRSAKYSLPALGSYFLRTANAGTIMLGRNGRPEITLSIVRSEGLKRPFPPPYSAPAKRRGRSNLLQIKARQDER